MSSLRRLLPALAAIALLGSPNTARSQVAANPEAEIARAVRLLRTGDSDSAVALLETLADRPDAEGRTWLLLGRTLRTLGRHSEARRALEGAAARDPGIAGAAYYQIGLSHGAEGNLDSAFDWLRRSDDTGTWDITQIARDPDSVPLREDPRFAALLPDDEELADPFLESVNILVDISGEGPGDQFGWIARTLGDVNGDDVADLVTSAPTRGEGGSGKVYVFSGLDGSLIWARDGVDAEGLGLALSATGDADGDGVSDVVAGAPNASRVYLLSGRDGHVIHRIDAVDGAPDLGATVSGVGDLDDDGFADVLVAAPGASSGAGRVDAHSGATGNLIWSAAGAAPGALFGSAIGASLAEPDVGIIIGAGGDGVGRTGRAYVLGADGSLRFSLNSDDTARGFGRGFASVLGDVDGDGSGDLFIVDFTNVALGPATGRAYVYSGTSGEELRVWTGTVPGEGFGIGSADIGDVDGDGYADAAIGAWRYGGEAPVGGRVYLLSGHSGELLGTVTGTVPGETFGFDSAGAGDVDGDGIPDLLATSARSSIRGAWSGRVYIISGASIPMESR